MKKKEIEVIDMHGAKTVAKKTSYITWTKRVFAIVSVLWLTFAFWAPLHIKNTYAAPIKKSIVVSMFFDLQRNIVEQYEKLLDGIKKSIDLEKPVSMAIDQVKVAEKAVGKVTDATAAAKKTTDQASRATGDAKKVSGLMGRFGVKTDGIDRAIASADQGIQGANKGIAQVDQTAALVNKKLDQVEQELNKVLQVQIDQMIDQAVKQQLDKNSGGLGTTLLTNYGIKHVYPWRPSTWPVATKIYNDLSKSDVAVIQIITRTVDKYFGYVAWGLVIAAWVAGAFVWLMLFKKVKAMISPFIVCPRCGHTFADKRTAYGLLKALQPWKWL